MNRKHDTFVATAAVLFAVALTIGAIHGYAKDQTRVPPGQTAIEKMPGCSLPSS